jgi:hypothetical protein
MGLSVEFPPWRMGPAPGPAGTRAEDGPAPRVLIGGVVAYNEELRIGGAIRSLLDQSLPRGWRWGTVWVVASGCTDRTVEIAEGIAKHDGRVRVVVEAQRRGKARALAGVFKRAEGDALVLLNSDARARPGAVEALLQRCDGQAGPLAVMGRPVPLPGRNDPLDRSVRLMWDLHDEFHQEVLGIGIGTHLSDELLLVSLPWAAPIPEEIINDGSFIGAWLAACHGQRLYAPEATVETVPPRSLRDHLHQRRRIIAGHAQTGRILGISPSTLPRYAVAHPLEAVRILRRTLDRGDYRWGDLAALSLAELGAQLLALWDRVPPRPDHVRWRRISEEPASPAPARGTPSPSTASDLEPAIPVAAPTAFLDRRVATLLGVSRRFGTGIELRELSSLLPPDGPGELPELREWLATRPALASLEGDRVYPANARPADLAEREDRAAAYRSAAEQLLDRHLRPVLRWVRCVGITGSTAYGVPEAGDDLDFFVVTRRGSLWVFLAYAYLAIRVRFRPRVGSDRPLPCFNYVLEDAEAERDYRGARGFLFAREALTAQILRGESYYQDLLATAPWLAAEIPRLYARRSSGVPPRSAPPAPWPIRLVNGLVFPLLATYLQLVGLRRNARARATTAGEGQFRTVVGRHRLAFVSQRFDRLGDDLAPASVLFRDVPGVAPVSRTIGSR